MYLFCRYDRVVERNPNMGFGLFNHQQQGTLRLKKQEQATSLLPGWPSPKVRPELKVRLAPVQ